MCVVGAQQEIKPRHFHVLCNYQTYIVGHTIPGIRKHTAVAKAVAHTHHWNVSVPPFRLATPPRHQVNSIPEGNLEVCAHRKPFRLVRPPCLVSWVPLPFSPKLLSSSFSFQVLFCFSYLSALFSFLSFFLDNCLVCWLACVPSSHSSRVFRCVSSFLSLCPLLLLFFVAWCAGLHIFRPRINCVWHCTAK